MKYFLIKRWHSCVRSRLHQYTDCNVPFWNLLKMCPKSLGNHDNDFIGHTFAKLWRNRKMYRFRLERKLTEQILLLDNGAEAESINAFLLCINQFIRMPISDMQRNVFHLMFQ